MKQYKAFAGLWAFVVSSYYIQHCFICRPSDSTVPTDAGIEPRTVATGALAVRRSNRQWYLDMYVYRKQSSHIAQNAESLLITESCMQK
jgi:hypothetical protein